MDWQGFFRKKADEERWSWADLAKATDIKQNTMQNWVNPNARKGRPSIAQAIRIAEVMNLSLDEVFRGRIPGDPADQILARASEQMHALIRSVFCVTPGAETHEIDLTMLEALCPDLADDVRAARIERARRLIEKTQAALTRQRAERKRESELASRRSEKTA